MRAAAEQFARRVTRWLVALSTGPESPHEVALGVGIGVAVAFTPTLGGQMALAGALAGLCRGSVRSALPMVWITNPLTAGPIYFAVYRVGRWAMMGAGPGDPRHAVDAAQGLSLAGAAAAGTDILVPMMIGGAAVGIVLGGVSYAAVRWAVAQRRGAACPAGLG